MGPHFGTGSPEFTQPITEKEEDNPRHGSYLSKFEAVRETRAGSPESKYWTVIKLVYCRNRSIKTIYHFW